MLKLLAVIMAVVIIAGCTQTSQPANNTIKKNQTKANISTNLTNMTNLTNSTIACIPPQIKSGTGCCLDSNGNGICDSNDKCLNVTCGFYCSDKILYYGRCVDGACKYSQMTCPDACANGRCISHNPLYMNTSFGIDANWTVGSNMVFVDFTNTGTQAIDMTQVSIFLNDKYATNTTSGNNTGILASGNFRTINVTLNITKGGTATCASTVRATLASGQAQSVDVRCFAKGFGKILVMNPWSIMASNGAVRLNIMNMMANEINITGAKVGSYAYNASQVLAPGESANVSFATSRWSIKKSSTSYSSAVTVYYNYTSNGTASSSAGTISGAYI